MSVTLEQMAGLIQSSDLDGRLQAAVAVVADQIQSEDVETPNHANRIKWAKAAFMSPGSVANQVKAAVYAAKQDVCEPAGLTISDADLQATIAAAVNTFADGS